MWKWRLGLQPSVAHTVAHTVRGSAWVFIWYFTWLGTLWNSAVPDLMSELGSVVVHVNHIDHNVDRVFYLVAVQVHCMGSQLEKTQTNLDCRTIHGRIFATVQIICRDKPPNVNHWTAVMVNSIENILAACTKEAGNSKYVGGQNPNNSETYTFRSWHQHKLLCCIIIGCLMKQFNPVLMPSLGQQEFNSAWQKLLWSAAFFAR